MTLPSKLRGKLRSLFRPAAEQCCAALKWQIAILTEWFDEPNVWISSGGRRIPMREMHRKHLTNAIHCLRTEPRTAVYQRRLVELQAEYRRRCWR